MTTRSTAFLHVLSVLDLDQEAQDILSNMRVTNVSGLLRLTTEALNANLPIGYVNNITTFKHWYFNYRANNNGQSPTDIVSEFTTEIFDDFMVEQVEATYQPPTTTPAPTTPLPSTPFTNPGGVSTPYPATPNTQMTTGAQNPSTKASIKDIRYKRYPNILSAASK